MANDIKKTYSVPADIELISAEIPNRINWTSISNQVLAVLNIERGIFYTLIELLLRPGKAVRVHLFKNRKRLLNPIRFLVLSTTLATLITFHYFTNSDFSESFNIGFNSSQDELNSPIKNEAIALIGNRLIDMLKQLINLSYFFLAPVGAMASWVFVRKKFNTPELAVANCYMWSMVNCITIFFTPFMKFEGLEFLGYGVTGLFALIYPLFFYSSLLQEGLKGFLKAFLMNGINLFLTLIFFVILAVFTFYDIESLLRPNASSF